MFITLGRYDISFFTTCKTNTMHSLICECKNVFKRLSRYYLIFYEKFKGRLLGQLYLHIIHHSVSILTRTMSTCSLSTIDYCNTIVRVV